VLAKWERMWGYRDSQEVGLEAATLERVRNSSLVKWSCAEDITGLKLATEATGTWLSVSNDGSPGAVGERSAAWKAYRKERWSEQK
jgi:hypothetical protein